MWENNQKSNLAKNLLLAVLIVLLLIALLVAMLHVRRENAVHDAQLSEIHVQQQQEQSAARMESVNAIQEEYEKDLQTVADYIPGIVCWGDEITTGSSGYINYPYVLQTYINTYLCDIYDFRSTIENAEDFSRLKWDDYTISIPVVNMGSGKESTYTILGRSGTVPYVVGEDFVIPAATEPVSIKLLSESGKSVTPLTGGNAGVNPVVINGVEGALSIDSESYNSYSGELSYFFTRSMPGSETPVSAGTEITTAAASMYRDYIHVVFIGTYGDYTTPEDLVRQTRALLSRQAQNPDRFIVVGVYSTGGYTSSYGLDAVDSAMMQAFGNRYINIRKYLVGDGYTDAGIRPSGEDSYYISANAVPPSFLVASGSVELNQTAQKLLGKLIFNRMDSLGYFEEINNELKLADTTKQILKDDPDYFSRIITNTLR